MNKFLLVLPYADGCVNILDALHDEGQVFDTLQECLDYVNEVCKGSGFDPRDCTIWTPHPVKVTIGI